MGGPKMDPNIDRSWTSFWEGLGSVLGASWRVSWGVLGRLGGVLGASWVVLGVSWVDLGRLGRHFGPSWGCLGPTWPVLVGVLGRLERFWEHLAGFRGSLSGPVWGRTFRRGQTRWSTLFLRRPPEASKGDCLLCPLVHARISS